VGGAKYSYLPRIKAPGFRGGAEARRAARANTSKRASREPGVSAPARGSDRRHPATSPGRKPRAPRRGTYLLGLQVVHLADPAITDNDPADGSADGPRSRPEPPGREKTLGPGTFVAGQAREVRAPLLTRPRGAATSAVVARSTP
jgi:hypothetical protein